jgi:hypothetical protein
MPHHQQATRAGSRKKAAHGGARQPGQRRTSGGMCVMVPSESVSMREVTMLRARPKSARGRARSGRRGRLHTRPGRREACRAIRGCHLRVLKL